MTEPVWTEAERRPNATPQTEPSHDGIEVRQLHSVMFDSLVVAGNTAASGGTCTVNKVPCTFIVQVQDNGAARDTPSPRRSGVRTQSLRGHERWRP